MRSSAQQVLGIVRPATKWVGGTVGVITGCVGATGVQIPSCRSCMIGMEGRLVQALGCSSLRNGGAGLQPHRTGLLTPLPRCGRWRWRPFRRHVHRPGGALADAPETFRRWFLIAMILLGLYLVGSTVYSIFTALSSAMRTPR
jgi:hypothetical protein